MNTSLVWESYPAESSLARVAHRRLYTGHETGKILREEGAGSVPQIEETKGVTSPATLGHFPELTSECWEVASNEILEEGS